MEKSRIDATRRNRSETGCRRRFVLLLLFVSSIAVLCVSFLCDRSSFGISEKRASGPMLPSSPPSAHSTRDHARDAPLVTPNAALEDARPSTDGLRCWYCRRSRNAHASRSYRDHTVGVGRGGSAEYPQRTVAGTPACRII
jgi:hypothetical protein